VEPVPDPGVVEEPVPVVPLVLAPEVLELLLGVVLGLDVPAAPFMLPFVPVLSGVVVGCPGVPVLAPLVLEFGVVLEPAAAPLWSVVLGVAAPGVVVVVLPLWPA
jgi:hypothetical protein